MYSTIGKPTAFNPHALHAHLKNEASEDDWSDFDGDEENGEQLIFVKENINRTSLSVNQDEFPYAEDIQRNELEDGEEQEDYFYAEGSDYYFENDRNSITSRGGAPGSFYPEQPYVPLPVVPKPSSEVTSSKFKKYILTPLRDISIIYIKFLLLAVLIYACAVCYAAYFGDLNSIKDLSPDFDDDDTCAAEYFNNI